MERVGFIEVMKVEGERRVIMVEMVGERDEDEVESEEKEDY